MPFRHPSYYKSRSVEMPTRWPIIIKFRKKKKEEEEKRRKKKKEEEERRIEKSLLFYNIYHSNAVLIYFNNCLIQSEQL